MAFERVERPGERGRTSSASSAGTVARTVRRTGSPDPATPVPAGSGEARPTAHALIGGMLADRRVRRSATSIQREFVETEPQRFRDESTGKEYEQCEVRVDDRLKVAGHGEAFYLYYADGAWDRAKVGATTAMGRICAELKAKMSKDSNYSVAVLGNGDLLISKVNGVTSATAKMNEIRSFIEGEGLQLGRTIHLARKYNTGLGSNHAEMCILAAAKALNQPVRSMSCTGPNCPYCATMLAHEQVVSTNAGQDGKAQMGWAHPWEPWFWGQQVSATASLGEQVEDLRKFLTTGATPGIGSAFMTPSQGRSDPWIEG